jgi:inorganic pyrophosphatase
MHRFWKALDELVSTSELKIDRPKGSAHPRFPEYVYPVDYGYLDGTVGGDGEGVDVWRGSQQPGRVVGVVCAVDPHKRNAELKVLLSCTDEEIADIEAFYLPQPQAALLHRRTTRGWKADVTGVRGGGRFGR